MLNVFQFGKHYFQNNKITPKDVKEMHTFQCSLHNQENLKLIFVRILHFNLYLGELL